MDKLEFIVETQGRVDELGGLINVVTASMRIRILPKGAWRDSESDWGKYEFCFKGKTIGKYEFRLVDGVYKCLLELEGFSSQREFFEVIGSKFPEVKQSPAYK